MDAEPSEPHLDATHGMLACACQRRQPEWVQATCTSLLTGIAKQSESQEMHLLRSE